MRAAIYVRVSTDFEEQETSLVHQRQFFESYVKEKGWDIHDIYTDIQSGTKNNRKELMRLIADAKSKNFDVILAKELSRLARNQTLALELKEVIERHKVHLITMDGAIDTTNGNTQMFGLYAWIYEQESQTTSKRMKMALKTKAKNGLYIGSIPPYGYQLKSGKLYVREDETPSIVKEIFVLYIQGNGFDAIARILYNRGVRTPSEVVNKKNAKPEWHGSTVRKILENIHYTGSLVTNRTSTISVTSTDRTINPKEEYLIVENKHAAIISKETFEIVQQLIYDRRKKNSRAHENKHLFTGVAYCSDCGSSLHYKKNRKGYICGKYNKLGKKACSDHHVLEQVLISTIQHDLGKLVEVYQDDIRLKDLEKVMKKDNTKIEKEQKKNVAEINKLKVQKDKALSKFIEEEITKENYNNYITNTDNEIAKLLEIQKQLEERLKGSMNTSHLDVLKETIEIALSFNELNRETINRFIEKIEIKEDKTIKLYYRFAVSDKLINELY